MVGTFIMASLLSWCLWCVDILYTFLWKSVRQPKRIDFDGVAVFHMVLLLFSPLLISILIYSCSVSFFNPTSLFFLHLVLCLYFPFILFVSFSFYLQFIITSLDSYCTEGHSFNTDTPGAGSRVPLFWQLIFLGFVWLVSCHGYGNNERLRCCRGTRWHRKQQRPSHSQLR